MNAERYNRIKRDLFNKAYGFLNERQREAVFTVKDPLLVLAGAGSGKTTVLVHRIAFILRYGNAYYHDISGNITEQDLIRVQGYSHLEGEELFTALEEFAVDRCPAWAVLSITFTNKAAKEMKERLVKRLGEGGQADEIWSGTFHSVCVRILRRNGEDIGLASNFTIYDTDDTKKLLSKVMKDLNIDEKALPVKTVANLISKYKEALAGPDDVEVNEKDFKLSRTVKIYKEYQKRLKEAAALDFDDIIMKTVELLESSENARNYYQSRFKYVCIDEYQDTNLAQFRLAYLLSGKYQNIMVVGDDDQSIYKFRGATIKNILEFDKSYPKAKTVKLEQNYRSTQIILDAANAVISNNAKRKGKNLWTENKKGEAITLKKLNDQNAEGTYIANCILETVKKEGRKFADFAVLYRMNAQSNAIEKVFAKSGISYRVLGGTRFYDRKEIKDIMSYLALVNNTGDNLRLTRIINEPKRKIGQTTMDAVASIAQNEGVSYFEVIENAFNYKALSKAAPTLVMFADLIKKLIFISKTETLSSLFTKTIEMTGYKAMLLAAGEAEADRLENIEELVSNAVEYEDKNDNATLQSFLEEVALISDVDNYDNEADAVVMMTVHSAKGLEFPVVFLPGMENGIFPGAQSITEPEEMEEERRLAYVAITRAKERLYCTHVQERLMFGRTQYNPLSKFITEIPSSLLNVVDETRHKNYVFDQSSYGKGNSYQSRQSTNAVGYGSASALGNKPSTAAQAPVVFAVGETVIHPSFGKGEILSVRSMGKDCMYEIAFDDFGTKKLMGSYAKLKKA